jgi:hypothetical protein
MVAVPPKRTIVYIDGFNLYYGVFKTVQCSRYKWLDLDAYFTQLLPAHNITAIKYCSALVNGKRDPGAHSRQREYWRALRTLRLTRIIEGRFKDKSVKCNVPTCAIPRGPQRLFSIPEEKRTDVNLALEILDDAHRGLADAIVVVSGDSDLVPALQKIRDDFPQIEVSVYVPAAFNRIRGKAPELRALAHRPRNFDTFLLARAQLPANILLPDGSTITKPATW